MRRMEILSIRLEHIYLRRRVIYIPTAKAGAREQSITEHLASFLAGDVDAAEPNQEWLFPSARSRSTGHAMSIENAFRRVVVAAGLDAKQVVRHTLRHTASHIWCKQVWICRQCSGSQVTRPCRWWSDTVIRTVSIFRLQWTNSPSVTDPQAGSFCVHDYTGITHSLRKRVVSIIYAIDFMMGR